MPDLPAGYDALKSTSASAPDFRQIFDATEQFMGLLTPTGAVIRLNQMALDLVALQLEPLIGCLIWETAWFRELPQEQIRLQAEVQRAATGERRQFELTIRSQTGEVLFLDTSCKPLFDAAGQLLQILVEGRNITERKRLEAQGMASELQMRLALDWANIATWRWAPGQEIFCSESGPRLLGLPPFASLPYEIWQASLHPEDRLWVEQALLNAVETGSDYSVEYRVCWPDSSLHWLSARGKGIYDEAGNLVEMLGAIMDVTERKQTELSLQESRQFIQSIADSSPNILYIFDLDQQRPVYANREATDLGYGADAADEVISDYRVMLHPDDRERVSQHHAAIAAAAEREVIEIEYRLQQKDGGWRWFSSRDTPFKRDAAGRVWQYLGAAQDITQRKQAEMALRESELRYWEIVEQQTDLICRFLPDGTITFVNDAYCRYFGKSRQALIGQAFEALLPPENWQAAKAAIARFSPDNRVVQTEHSVMQPDGSIRWQQWMDRAIYDADQHLLEIQGVGRDITERKLAIEALQASELKLRQITDAIPGVVYQYCQAGDREWFPMINRGIEALSGLTPEQVQQNAQLMWDRILPADLEAVALSVQRSFTDLSLWQAEYRIQALNGEIKWITGHATPTQLENGGILWNGVLVDISQLKRTEAELQESQSRYGLATRAAKVGVWDWNLQTGEFFVDPNLKQILGYEDDEILNDLGIWSTYIHPDDQAMVMELAQAYLDGQLPSYACEHRMLHKDGTVRWLLARGEVIRDAAGAPVRMVGTDTDITDRKQLEAQLQEREAFLQTIYDGVGVIIFVVEPTADGDFIHIDVNSVCETLFGIPRALILGKTLSEFGAFQSLESIAINQARYRHCFATGESMQFEESSQLRGEEVWWLTRMSPVVELDGRIHRVITSTVSITDRKRAEAALQASEQRYRTLVNNIPGAVFRGTRHQKWLVEFLSDGVEAIIGHPATDFTDSKLRTLADHIHPEDKAKVSKQIHEQISERRFYEVEYRLIHADGSLRWIYEKGQPITTARFSTLEGIAFDISDRKRLEEALRHTNLEMQAIFDAFPDLFFRMDQQGRILDSKVGNSQDQRLQPGRSTEPTFCDILPAEISQRLQTAIVQTLETQSVVSLEYSLLNQVEPQAKTSQPEEFFEARLVPIPGQQVVATIRNISGRKRAEIALNQLNQQLEDRVTERTQDLLATQAALQQSEQFLRSIYEGVDHPIVVVDVLEDDRLRQVGWNPATERATGISSVQVMGRTLEEIFEHDQLLEIQQNFQRCIVGGAPVSYEERRQFGSTEKWFFTTLHPLRDDQARIYRIIGTMLDITDRKQLEQEQARLLAILEASSDYIGIATPDGRVLWTNAQLKQLRAGEESAMIKDFHPHWAAELILQQGLPTANLQGTWIGETAILAPDGTEIPVSQLILGHTDAERNIRYFSTIMRDISDRKQAEAALQQINSELENRVQQRTAELTHSKEAAEAASRAKSQFLANMSHELRTPLNAILGFSQLMARDCSLDHEQQQQLGIINRNGEHLLTLINDILEMSKIEAGRATLNPAAFDLHHLIQSITEMFRLKASAKGLVLQVEQAATLPQFVYTDESKLRQVLVNLLSNAIKFTEAGQVTLQVDCQRPEIQRPETQPILTLWFSITDTGLGIAAADFDLLFEPFVQTETGLKSQEGTGLGLPISREFVQLMGGDLTLVSHLGEGSRFCFTIQVEPIDALSPAVKPKPQHVIGLQPDQPKHRILIAEDNWANRALLVELLQSVGFEVQVAENGQEAVQLWQDWSPHLIWMDIRMPVMDGYEATRQIRALAAESATESATEPAANSAPVIIALTASVFEEERRAILAAGCNDFVRKPVAEAVLFEKMAAYLGVQYRYQIEAEPTVPLSLPDSELTAELLALPAEWLAQLHRAAQIADEELILQLIAQIAVEHSALAEALIQLVDEFCLEQIIDLTQPGK